MGKFCQCLTELSACDTIMASNGRVFNVFIILTFTILWANSVDDKLIFFLFFPVNRI